MKWATESKLSTNLLHIHEPRPLSSPDPVFLAIHWVRQGTCFWRITADTSKFIIYNQGSSNHAWNIYSDYTDWKWFYDITTLVNSGWQSCFGLGVKTLSNKNVTAHTLLFNHLCNCSSFLPFIDLFVYSAKKLKSAFIPGNATLVWMVLSFTCWIA